MSKNINTESMQTDMSNRLGFGQSKTVALNPSDFYSKFTLYLTSDLKPVQKIESDLCNICEIDIRNNRQYCKKCGQSVCKGCSRRRLNEQKLKCCDLCFYEILKRNMNQENDKKKYLKTMDIQLKQIRSDTEQYQQQMDEVEQQIGIKYTEYTQLIKHQNTILKQLEEEQQRKSQQLQETVQHQDQLKQIQQNYSDQLKSKENTLEQLNNKIYDLDSNIKKLQQQKKNKEQELGGLNDMFQGYNSYLVLQKSQKDKTIMSIKDYQKWHNTSQKVQESKLKQGMNPINESYEPNTLERRMDEKQQQQ